MVQRKIKVLVITHAFPTKYNPISAIFIPNQLQELKKYCDIKVMFPFAYVPKIKFFNPYHRFSKIKEREKIYGIEVYHPKYFMFPRILFLSKLLNILLVIEAFLSYNFSKKLVDKLMKDWNPDIAHMHGPLGDGLIGIRIKKKYGKPLLLTVHGEDVTRYLKRMFSKTLTKITLKNSDAVICQSKFLENEIKKSGVRDKKFYVIPMGAKTGRFKPRDKEKVRKILRLPKDKKIILFVGHLYPRKGVTYLVRAMEEVVKKEKNILCCMIGKGDQEQLCKKMAAQLKLEPYIKFLGIKTNDEVALYMNACNVFVLPSLMEGLPAVLYEALSCGKPVVASAVAGIPELVTEDVGYLVKPKNPGDLSKKIILALNRKWDLKKLVKRGNEFSTESSAKKLFDLYNQVLKI
ncbi:glycosyltransferase family 4 protein [Candidatus Woesearchaeota archaeon]|nr:glycosyltransferase family 4 protein [Candidatus Woesearchaeota archaeon]